MTPAERARKIVTDINANGAEWSNTDENYWDKEIAREIREAELEGERLGMERAAKMVEELELTFVVSQLPNGEWVSETSGKWMARKIRQTAQELGKKP